MSLAIRLRDDDPTPPYEQLRSQVAAAIATGTLPTGAKLPTVRQLAGDLGVAPGTVARAWKELEQAGLVTTARRAGTTVTGRPSNDPQARLNSLASSFVTEARRLGASDAAIRVAIGEALDD